MLRTFPKKKGSILPTAVVALAAIIAHHMRRQVRLNRLKSDLASTVSHELKTPLASMRVLVDTLLDGEYQNKQRTHEYLQLIARENVRLSQLIDNFLTFSRLEKAVQVFTFSDINLTQVATAALGAQSEQLSAQGFLVETAVPSNPVLITADQDAVTTTILNLVDNARKYSEDDKRIVLRVYEDGQVGCLEVEDHGIEMSQREIAKVFDRFYQVDQNLARKVDGCGLGLNIVKSIVKAHGGSISVDSRPGEGSKFAARFPLASAPSPRSSRVSG